MTAAACHFIDTDAALADSLPRLRAARVLGVDVESNGMFVFAPRLCTLQIAAARDDGEVEVLLIDTLAVDVKSLAPIFADRSIAKVVHDLSFDAAMLARAGAPFDRVFDTAIAARFVGHTATGLSSVLGAELGIRLDKRLQTSDWALRPLSDAAIAYLAADVAHLPALAARLSERMAALDVAEEVELECAHRLATAAVAQEPLPPFARIKGFRGLSTDAERVLLRDLAAARDALAEDLDLPAGRVASRDALMAIVGGAARGRPEVGRHVHHGAGRVRLQAVIDRAASALPLDPTERSLFAAPPAPDRETVLRRRRAEALLSRFRKEAAAARAVPDQVVLPGHLHRDLVVCLADARSNEEVRAWLATEKIGPKRLALYGDAIVSLRERLDQVEEPPAAEEDTITASADETAPS